MKNINKSLFLICSFGTTLLMSCNGDATPDDAQVVSQTPVQVSTIAYTSLSEGLDLNATSTYLEKSSVKATINGYLQTAAIQVGSTVHKNQLLYSLITKEARAIGNSINELDPGFKFSGISNIRAIMPGYVSQVSHQKGDYVQDGEVLAVISNQNSLAFLLDLPYELHKLIKENKTLQIVLPDGQKLTGRYSSSLSAVDSVAQTQRLIIKVDAKQLIPENLIAKVRVIRSAADDVQSLPKSAVLTNETEDVFWVMKMINDTTAVKILVKKGMEEENIIQILTPKFDRSDRIITVGNYGLADTAKVKIVKLQKL
jgi:multidrug efflux pump subunit AcrA (membrane-fusion protein)